ncbi:MAG: PPOX class F420-dependent oxidoreductase [Chloroflexota bacterium]|nr:PPOX class F420-dependent oxidoreductase [Chloroflexota bacterium]
MTTEPRSFRDLQHADIVLLTSFRRDGTPVGTPVHFAVEASRGYARTYDAAGKYKRIRRYPMVEIAPATTTGRQLGPARRATVRLLSGDEARAAARRLASRHPILHGWLIPAYHRLRGWRTVHMELTAVE